MKVYKILKPGIIFVNSSTCVGGVYSWFELIASIGKALGLLLLVIVFTAQHLIDCLTYRNFAIGYQWQPSNDMAIFIVVKKSR